MSSPYSSVSSGETLFDLVRLFWRQKRLLLIIALVPAIFGGVLSYILPESRIASAKLVPLVAAEAEALLPRPIPGSPLRKRDEYRLDELTLFTQTYIQLAKLESQLESNSDAFSQLSIKFEAGEREREIGFITLESKSSSEKQALNDLTSWLSSAEKNILLDLHDDFERIRKSRLLAAESELEQLLQQEQFSMQAEHALAVDELSQIRVLQKVGAELEMGSLQFDGVNLYSEEVPLYLLSTAQLKARAGQLELEIQQLENSAGKGYTLKEWPELSGYISMLKRITFESLTLAGETPAAFNFERLPVIESFSTFKRFILFVIGGGFLGGVVGMVVAIMREALSDTEGIAARD